MNYWIKFRVHSSHFLQGLQDRIVSTLLCQTFQEWVGLLPVLRSPLPLWTHEKRSSLRGSTTLPATMHVSCCYSRMMNLKNRTLCRAGVLQKKSRWIATSTFYLQQLVLICEMWDGPSLWNPETSMLETTCAIFLDMFCHIVFVVNLGQHHQEQNSLQSGSHSLRHCNHGLLSWCRQNVRSLVSSISSGGWCKSELVWQTCILV